MRYDIFTRDELILVPCGLHVDTTVRNHRLFRFLESGFFRSSSWPLEPSYIHLSHTSDLASSKQVQNWWSISRIFPWYHEIGEENTVCSISSLGQSGTVPVDEYYLAISRNEMRIYWWQCAVQAYYLIERHRPVLYENNTLGECAAQPMNKATWSCTFKAAHRRNRQKVYWLAWTNCKSLRV